MFLAQFKQVSSDKFKADKNGNFPFIGKILAGTATGSIYNGTMFKRDGLKTNTMYACQNFTDPQRPEFVQTEIISEVSVLDFKALSDQLGSARLDVATPE